MGKQPLLDLLDSLMLRTMIDFKVDMNKGAFAHRQLLNLVLQVLANVVREPEWRLWLHHNVHLDDVLGTRVIGLHAVDHLDVLIVDVQGVVRAQLQELDGSSSTAKLAELFKSGTGPADDDPQTDDDSTCRVDPPGNLGTGSRSEDTKATEEEKKKKRK